MNERKVAAPPAQPDEGRTATAGRAGEAPRSSQQSDRETHVRGATVPDRAIGPALGLVAAIVLAEYAARRVLAPALLTIGAPVVDDMLATALCYGLLVTYAAAPASRSLAGLGGALRAVGAGSRSWPAWIGAVLFLLTGVALAPRDARLWGPVTLPSYTAPRADAALLTEAARPLGIAALLLVNGLVIPLAEERLWRGAIQPRLVAACGLLPGLLATAVLFSLKHAIVDASLGRLIAITAGGLVLGVVAHRAAGPGLGRSGWPTSAVSHAVGNTVATCLAIAAGAL